MFSEAIAIGLGAGILFFLGSVGLLRILELRDGQ